MKKYITLLLLLLSSNIYGQQKWALGFKGAFELRGSPSNTSIQGDTKGTSSLPSYGIGLFAKRHIWRRFSITAEPAFHNIGSGTFSEYILQSKLISSNCTHVRYSAILIPVGINYKVGLKTAIEIGTAPTFLLNGKRSQIIYNSSSKTPNQEIEEGIEAFYQKVADFPFFVGLNWQLNPKIELGVRIYGGTKHVAVVIQDPTLRPSYTSSNHNTGLTFAMRYNFLKISKKKDAHYKTIDDRF